jgi:hypothetical protein
MKNTSLHAQKVAILSRLIKETSLTLKEALLLLREEEEEVVVNYHQPYFGTNPILSGGTFTVPLTGSTSSFGVYNSNTTTSLTQQILGELEKDIEDATL